MPRPLRALIVEDSENDMLMMLYALELGGFKVTHTRVQTAEEMRAALEKESWDIVLSDYHMPQFNGLEAVQLLREKDRDTPLIIVSGTAGEETTVACMKGGAQNFIFKHRLALLVPAVERELEEAQNRIARRVAEGDLQLSEQRYQQLLESIIDYIYTVRVEEGRGVATVHGAGCESVMGYSPEEYIADPGLWLRMVPEEDQPAVLEQAALSLKGAETQPLEHRIRHKDGSLRWVRDTHVVRKNEGIVVGYDGIVVDITARKLAELELRKSEERFSSAFNNAAIGMAFAALDGRFLKVNPAMCRIVGYPEDEFLTRTFQEITHPDDAETDRSLVRRLVAGELQSYEREKRYLHKQGHVVWVQVNISLVRDDFNRPLWFSGQIQDISARKAAEEELQASEQRYRWVVEHSSDFTGVVDKSGTFTFASPSVERVLGITPHDIQGANAFALPIHPEDIAVVRGAFDRVISEPAHGMAVEFRLQHKDGSWRVLEALGNNLLDDPEVSGILLNIRDITEKKNLEARFLRAQRMESIGVLAGGIAHDLNNVLTPILLTIEVLRTQLPAASTGRFLDTLQNSAQRGADMIQQVLSFARGAEGQSLMIQPRHLILEVAKIIKQTLPKNIETRENVPRDLWCVTGDPTHLHQVLMNICVNARDAMPEGGWLEIAAQNIEIDPQFCSQEPEAKPGPYLQISVTDTGTGIPPEVMEHIFEPFFTTKEIGKGTGLGLATVIGIVKGHGGFVTVESQVGRGTAFRVHLPAHKTAVPSPASAAGAEAETGHGELILVVDDEEAVREMTRVALEAQGYRVVTATDGTEAVVAYAARKKEIVLVLTDMAMPFMDGRATIHALRKLNPEVRILAVSGLEKGAQLAGLDACHFLKKPYTAPQLFAAMRQTMSDQPLRRESDTSPPSGN